MKDGDVKVVSVPLAFLGTDSVQAALAAEEQNRYWPHYSLLFEAQGQENSGYVSRDFLEDLANRTPWLNVKEWDARLKKDSELKSDHSKVDSQEFGKGVKWLEVANSTFPYAPLVRCPTAGGHGRARGSAVRCRLSARWISGLARWDARHPGAGRAS